MAGNDDVADFGSRRDQRGSRGRRHRGELSTGHSAGSTVLTGGNHVGTLGSFTAAGFNLTNAAGIFDGGRPGQWRRQHDARNDRG